MVTEAFVDRAYTPQGTLVSRSEPGSVLTDVDHVARRATRMVTHREVEAMDGSIIRIDADSLCITATARARSRWQTRSAPS